MVQLTDETASTAISQASSGGSSPSKNGSHRYYVVMIDYAERGYEAVVDPALTRQQIVARIASGEYRNISFVHLVNVWGVADVTDEIMTEAETLKSARAA
jgi:hypothetical protein